MSAHSGNTWTASAEDHDWIHRAAARARVAVASTDARPARLATLIGWGPKRARVQFDTGKSASVDRTLVTLLEGGDGADDVR